MKIRINCKRCHKELIGEGFLIIEDDGKYKNYSICVCKKCYNKSSKKIKLPEAHVTFKK